MPHIEKVRTVSQTPEIEHDASPCIVVVEQYWDPSGIRVGGRSTFVIDEVATLPLKSILTV